MPHVDIKCFPRELTDEQIYDALLKAVDKYNRYRNWSESFQIESLESQTVNDLTRGESPKEGKYFILPTTHCPIFDLHIKIRGDIVVTNTNLTERLPI